jgi:hypothetical protein
MKLPLAALLATFALSSYAHGDHAHDDAPAPPAPPKVGSAAPASEKAVSPAPPKPATDDKAKEADKPVVKTQ